MIRVLPMIITGLLLNVLVGLIAGRIQAIWLCGSYHNLSNILTYQLEVYIAFGTAATGFGALLFAIIKPESPYWTYGFPSFILSVWGVDFIFACGTLFVAKIALPHEQSVAGGIFTTMTQVHPTYSDRSLTMKIP